jgi:hypothetical protein
VQDEQGGAGGQERTGERGDQRCGHGGELEGHLGRDVATQTGEIVKLVPEVQKELFHGGESTERVQALACARSQSRM